MRMDAARTALLAFAMHAYHGAVSLLELCAALSPDLETELAQQRTAEESERSYFECLGPQYANPPLTKVLVEWTSASDRGEEAGVSAAAELAAAGALAVAQRMQQLQARGAQGATRGVAPAADDDNGRIAKDDAELRALAKWFIRQQPTWVSADEAAAAGRAEWHGAWSVASRSTLSALRWRLATRTLDLWAEAVSSSSRRAWMRAHVRLLAFTLAAAAEEEERAHGGSSAAVATTSPPLLLLPSGSAAAASMAAMADACTYEVPALRDVAPDALLAELSAHARAALPGLLHGDDEEESADDSARGDDADDDADSELLLRGLLSRAESAAGRGETGEEGEGTSDGYDARAGLSVTVALLRIVAELPHGTLSRRKPRRNFKRFKHASQHVCIIPYIFAGVVRHVVCW